MVFEINTDNWRMFVLLILRFVIKGAISESV
ncbi:hypothetical protein SEETMRM10961_11300 [Salmonella enterica subsp. enterica serovar Typhimurium]|nr:hypothetical protein SEETMRM10961_11300 [Salmonella enterica subsp. enterica serovar Typhimurium]